MTLTPATATARAVPVRGQRAESVRQALRGVEAHGVGVLVAGAEDPVGETRADVAEHPDEQVVVVLPAGPGVAVMRRVLVGGAAGIVLQENLQALRSSVLAVAAGQLAVPVALVRQIAPRPLSHREKQVLGLVVEGCTNREIAQRLFVAESTVKTHLASVFAKLDAHSRAAVVARVLDPDSGYAPSMLLAPA
jgi:DNA-binding NarL/FixJ family response regulator